MGRLANRVALVSGGASGIGKASAVRLAEEGAKVVVAAIDAELGQQTVGAIQDNSGTATFMHLDVTNESQWQECVAATVDVYGGLNILVNNAGIAVGGSILTMTLEDWQRQQAINLDGVFLGVKYAIPAMIESGNGSVINISSVAGLRGMGSSIAYAASKGALNSMTMALSRSLGPDGIRVNAVCPGFVATDWWKNSLGDQKFEKAILAYEKKNPLGECPTAEDIIGSILFFASDLSNHVTGQLLAVDGGLLIGMPLKLD